MGGGRVDFVKDKAKYFPKTYLNANTTQMGLEAINDLQYKGGNRRKYGTCDNLLDSTVDTRY